MLRSILALAILPAAASAQDLSTGLVGYWRGDDSGTTATDMASPPHHGTYTNGAATDPSHATLKFTNTTSMSFDGANDNVDIPGFAWPAGGGPVTVAYWCYVATADIKTSSSFGVGPNSGKRFQCHGPWSDRKFHWDYGDANGPGRVTADWTAGYDNRWVHVAMTSRGVGGNYKAIYFDGAVAASALMSDGPDSAISGLTLGTCLGVYFRGKLDDFRIYNRELTPAEITKLSQGYGSGAPPNSPILLRQLDASGGASMPPGGASASGLVAAGTVNDPNLLQVRVEAEVQPVGTAFTGTPNAPVGAAVASGSEASAMPLGLPLRVAYHWQLRARNAEDLVSAWVSYGSDPDVVTEVDFTTGTNSAPTLGPPTQSNAAGVAIPPGGVLILRTLRVSATVADADAGERIHLEVEVCKAGEAFRGEASGSGSDVATGGVATVEVPLAAGSWRWQARAVDGLGGTSAWVRPLGSAAADITVMEFGSAGNSGCGASASVAPALLALALALVLASESRR